MQLIQQVQAHADCEEYQHLEADTDVLLAVMHSSSLTQQLVNSYYAVRSFCKDRAGRHILCKSVP